MEQQILVLGGNGFMGRRTVRALETLENVWPLVGSRSGEVHLDLTDSRTFHNLEHFDVVVNCADALKVRPDAAIRHVTDRGRTFVETTADPETVARLMAMDFTRSPGTLILGAGLFPGISNLLARDAMRQLSRCDSLEIGVRFSPFSGCGPGMVGMMIAGLESPVIQIDGGNEVPFGPITSGPSLGFKGGPRKTLRVGFSEPILLYRSTAIPAINMHFAPVPGFARSLALLSARAPRVFYANPVARWLNRAALWLMRCVFLRWRAADVELFAVARNAEQQSIRRAHAPDGVRATGHAIAAVVGAHLKVGAPRPGLLTVDEVIHLEDVVARMSDQGCPLAVDAPPPAPLD